MRSIQLMEWFALSGLNQRSSSEIPASFIRGIQEAGLERLVPVYRD
ncbi:MAG: hypothetical protein AB9873_12905 [Syntrophobacteraceae bacterium]